MVVSLRGGESVLGRYAEGVGVALPSVTQSASAGGLDFLRIGPDTALLVQAPLQNAENGTGAAGEALEAKCAAAESANDHGQAVDLSNERVVIGLGGAEFVAVMAQFCPLDFDTLPARTATGTVVAQIPAVLYATEDADLPWRFVLRRSYARWFLQLVEETARPYGVVIA